MRRESLIILIFALTGGMTLMGGVVCGQERKPGRGPVLQAETFRHYIDSFNTGDEELYPQYITNAGSWDFLSKNIPLFDCPDKQLEATWYFRWWTFRKHIRKTPEGFVILEFLPDVGWAGKYNTINCAAAQHIYEGRWLHEQQYITDYAKFWCRGGGDMKSYSCWLADALLNESLVTGDNSLVLDLEGDLINQYREWENRKLDSNGLYWQVPGQDGMEWSITGGGEKDRPGYRPSINAYRYGDAIAIARIAELAGRKEVSELFRQKAAVIRRNLDRLWDGSAGFFKVGQRGGSEEPGAGVVAGRPGSKDKLYATRELLGYTPWYFNMAGPQYARAWKFLMDPHYFYAPYGLTTAEQADPGFRVAYTGHECQWNGPSWPFSTSITLTALANQLNNHPPDYLSKKDYFRLLTDYARAQQRRNIDGKTVPWIDENLNPFTGDWISRTRLQTWDQGHWSAEKGGVERGKDYNHSTFCDLVITGLVGLRPAAGNRFVVNPLLPSGVWDYFCLDNLLYHGRNLTILYDRTGAHYRRGKGLLVFVDGKKAAAAEGLQRLQVNLTE